MHVDRPLASLLLSTSLVWLSGCDCGGTVGGEPCRSDDECAADLRCVDGRCETRDRVDSGPDPDCVDEDDDGLCAEEDCDDRNAQRGRAEVCDEIDNDCDGEVDEDFLGLCADCAPGCTAHEIPGAGGWMPTEENSEGVIVDDDGALTLGRNEARAFSVWVANMDEGTVSKLDSRTGEEVARYPTIGATAPAGARPWGEACNWSNEGNCPSRTAVDQNFDAYVANRAFGNQGTITKYANREADCVDRNGNGVIDTSRDDNGDGMIDMATEFVGPDDECILWTVAAGANNAWPRALAIGIAPPDGFVGDVWVGLFQQREACRLDPTTGATIACMPIDGYQPYGMAADSADRIWTVDRSGARRDILGYIESSAMTFTTVADLPADASCAVPYGVTVDGAGDVFLANQCDPSIWRYRHSTATWTPVDGGAAAFAGTTRGVAADETHLWVALSHDGDGFGGALSQRIRQYALADLSFVAEHTIPTGVQPIGIGVSFDNSIWAICQSNNIAARLDPATGVWTEHTVGLHPYTYSDFIGFGLNVFAEPRGRYAFVVEGCDDGRNIWRSVRYSADVPPGTSVEIYARTADARADLAAEAWVGPFEGNPTSLLDPPGPLPERRYLQVELRLSTADRMAAPRVFGVDVAGVCEPIID